MNINGINLYDTKSRTISKVTSKDDVVNIYCCGPTVYRDAHVGNLRTFLLADLVVRALTQLGFKSNFIQNITDVGHMADDLGVGFNEPQDKMLQQAAKENLDPFEIARLYESRFHTDLARLNINPADQYPRASETIDLIIGTIEKLIEIGSAYVSETGSVYFSAQSFPSYGAISGNRLDALKPGHKYEYSDDREKKFHADWALWKSAGGRTQMVWDSPWGSGFPGWHIECSAMSLSLLNKHVDVHIGGIDLRFPHHENERAQSNAAVGSEVVNLWLHGEHLLFEGRKMSKSSGNVVLLQDVIDAGLDPLSLRLCLLENRYRSQMDLTWDALSTANSTLQRWRTVMGQWGESILEVPDDEFFKAISADLDTPRALLRLRVIEKDSNISDDLKRSNFMAADQILGLDIAREIQELELSQEHLQLLSDRVAARSAKNWAESDRIRDLLALDGIAIHDSPTGQSWSQII